jgi:hypothetical protein
MKMNERNIGRILDVLQYAIQHFGKTFMEDDLYKACRSATSNIIDLLDEREVFTCTKDGISFDEGNIKEYRSFLYVLQDEIDDFNIPEDIKKEINSKIDLNLNFNFNLNLLNL